MQLDVLADEFALAVIDGRDCVKGGLVLEGEEILGVRAIYFVLDFVLVLALALVVGLFLRAKVARVEAL